MPNQNIKATPQEQIDINAQYAHALESNPLWKDCLNELEEAFTSQITHSKEAETELRERCYYMLRAVQELRNLIASRINSKALDTHRVRNVATGKS